MAFSTCHLSISISPAFRVLPVARAVPEVLADPVPAVDHLSTSTVRASQPDYPVAMGATDQLSSSGPNMVLMEEEEACRLHQMDHHLECPFHLTCSALVSV